MWDIPGVHNYGIKYFQVTMYVNDILHCLDLGMTQRFTGLACCKMLELNVWKSTKRNADDRHEENLLCIRKKMKEEYAKFHRNNPTKKFSRIGKNHSWNDGCGR